MSKKTVLIFGLPEALSHQRVKVLSELLKASDDFEIVIAARPSELASFGDALRWNVGFYVQGDSLLTNFSDWDAYFDEKSQASHKVAWRFTEMEEKLFQDWSDLTVFQPDDSAEYIVKELLKTQNTNVDEEHFLDSEGLSEELSRSILMEDRSGIDTNAFLAVEKLEALDEESSPSFDQDESEELVTSIDQKDLGFPDLEPLSLGEATVLDQMKTQIETLSPEELSNGDEEISFETVMEEEADEELPQSGFEVKNENATKVATEEDDVIVALGSDETRLLTEEDEDLPVLDSDNFSSEENENASDQKDPLALSKIEDLLEDEQEMHEEASLEEISLEGDQENNNEELGDELDLNELLVDSVKDDTEHDVAISESKIITSQKEEVELEAPNSLELNDEIWEDVSLEQSDPEPESEMKVEGDLEVDSSEGDPLQTQLSVEASALQESEEMSDEELNLNTELEKDFNLSAPKNIESSESEEDFLGDDDAEFEVNAQLSQAGEFSENGLSKVNAEEVALSSERNEDETLQENANSAEEENSGETSQKLEYSQEDYDTLKRYAALKEREAREKTATNEAIKSQLAKLREQLAVSTDERRRLQLSNEELKAQLRVAIDKRDENRHHWTTQEAEFEQKLKDYQVRLDSSEFKSAKAERKLEEFRERVRNDIQKIRSRERELANRLELQKRDAEALLSSKDEKLLQQKREIDRFEFDLETLKERLIDEGRRNEERSERLIRAIQSLKLAQGVLSSIEDENIADSSSNPGQEGEAA